MSEVEIIKLRDGRSLGVLCEGPVDGLALTFHVGTPCGHANFAPFTKAFNERGLRCVSYERPGYGLSTRLLGRSVADCANDVCEILEHFKIDKCIVMGWSGGGPHALATAALLGNCVLAVATIASIAPFTAEGLDWFAGMGSENVDEFKHAVQGEAVLGEWMQAASPSFQNVTSEEISSAFGDLVDSVDRNALNGDVAAYFAAIMRKGLRSGILGWLDDDLACAKDWGFDLSSIQVPVRIWQGDRDRMVPFAHGVWLYENIPRQQCHAHRHLSMAISSFGKILDDLVAAAGVPLAMTNAANTQPE